MNSIAKKSRVVMLLLLTLVMGVPLYAIPATLTLPNGPRPGIRKLTLAQAASQLQGAGRTGWQLVESARALVDRRMQYSRRNSFDSAARAFERGYGYCTQHAFALADLLERLGFEARVVHAFQNEFPDGSRGAHAWVSVTVDRETRYIDSLFYDPQVGEISFIPLSEVLGISPVFKFFAWWGATAVNAHRYYLTGRDD
jgi:hypothetical protein